MNIKDEHRFMVANLFSQTTAEAMPHDLRPDSIHKGWLYSPENNALYGITTDDQWWTKKAGGPAPDPLP